MSKGIPLSDADRWDWLIALRDHAVSVLAEPPPTNPSTGADTTLLPPSSATSPSPPPAVVVTCSALKLKYRDEFRVATLPVHSHGLNISMHFIYLAISQAESLKRVSLRKGHYMGAEMVSSQFESLEPPNEEEKDHDVIEVNVEQDVKGVMEDVIRDVQQALEDEQEEQVQDL
jgi:gluconokinase